MLVLLFLAIAMSDVGAAGFEKMLTMRVPPEEAYHPCNEHLCSGRQCNVSSLGFEKRNLRMPVFRQTGSQRVTGLRIWFMREVCETNVYLTGVAKTRCLRVVKEQSHAFHSSFELTEQLIYGLEFSKSHLYFISF